MTVIVPVDDPADPRVCDYVHLTDPDLRRRREQPGNGDGGYFIAEGVVVIRQLLRSTYRLRSLLLTPRRLEVLGPELAAVEAPVYLAGQDVVNAVTGFHLHRGAVASADRGVLPDPLALAADVDLLVVTEGINDHENLGALFRNAAAFGAAAVLLDPTSADPLYRRSIRVSVGHVLRVPFALASPWPQTLAGLAAMGFELVALTPASDAEDLGRVTRRPRQALLVGAEGPGLTTAALAATDRRARIPMAAGVDSLNVAAATAVALHHLGRGG